MHEDVKVQSKLKLKLQDVGDARIMGCSLRKATGMKWSWPETDHTFCTKEMEPSKSFEAQRTPSQLSDARHRVAKSGVCSAGFQSCFDHTFLATF